MDSISRLLKPRSVAVIGASADATKTAGRPVSYLVKHGFAGAIYPVNPKVDRIGELTCYPDVASLPDVPDVGCIRWFDVSITAPVATPRRAKSVRGARRS